MSECSESKSLFQDIFQGKFNKSMLNYAEVLNYERHRALGHRINQINEYLGKISGACLLEWCQVLMFRRAEEPRAGSVRRDVC